MARAWGLVTDVPGPFRGENDVPLMERTKGGASVPDALDIIVDDRRLTVVTRRRDARSIEVSVIDTGTGVKTTELARLFDSFYTTKPHGMGLGLSIARAIVQTHGGNLWAQSNGARGATFTFTIPLAA